GETGVGRSCAQGPANAGNLPSSSYIQPMPLRSRILSPFVVALFLLLTLPTAWPGEGPGPVLAAGAGAGYLVPRRILLGAASLIDPSLYETVQERSTREPRPCFDAVT